MRLPLNLLALLDPTLPQPAESVWHDIVRDWHNDVILMIRDRLPKVAIIVGLLFLVQQAVRLFADRMIRLAARRDSNVHRSAQLRTMAAIIRATSYSILGFLTFLQILHLLNINYGPLLASAGIVGVGIGLGAQSLFKDLINGIFILVEDQFNVGDTVKIASLTGTVEDLTFRLTRLRDGDGTLYIIPNSQISTVSNLSRDFAVATLSISVDASADTQRVLDLLNGIAHQIGSDPKLKPYLMADPTVSGIDQINGRALSYSISARVQIAQKDDVLHALRNRIVDAFKHEGIPLGIDPANMLLIQQQKAAAPDPTAPPSQQPIVQS